MLLAIDIGTSSAKAILFDPDAVTIIAVASKEYPVYRPQPDHAEQNPGDWWQAVVKITHKIVADHKPADIHAIGLTGQMHGTVLLDKAAEVIHPAIIWADQRSANVLDDMVSIVGAEAYTSVAGTLPAAGFMGATLVWLTKHQPELLAQADHVILPKDYIRLRLTGEIATDTSDAASTALFDIKNKYWSEKLINELQLDQRIFPNVLESATTAGQLTQSAAAELGLSAGIPVIAGCADQPAQALANGLIKPGLASVTTGTGGQIFIPTQLSDQGELATDPRLHVFNHAIADQIYILGAILSAGSALRWLRGIVGLGNDPQAYTKLSQEAAEVSVGSDGLIFLPYLVGERTPHMDPTARGAFIGLTAYHTRGHLARAVMEGVTYALKQTLDVSMSLTKPANRIIIAGGGAESKVWKHIQADVFGVPLQQTLQAEQTCIGAAILAGVASGDYATIDDGVHATTQYSDVVEPDQHKKRLYQGYFEQFVSLFPRLQDDFHQLTRKA